MSLIKPTEDWFVHYLLRPEFAHYAHSSGGFMLSPHLIADVLTIVIKPFFRFHPESDTWYKFNGQVWEPSRALYGTIMQALSEIKARLMQAAIQAKKPINELGYAGVDSLLNAQFPYAVITSLEHHSELFVDIKEFDNDFTLLNTPGSVVNLQTLETFPNRPQYMCRHITEIAPKDDEDGKKCPHYLNHLKFMAEGNKEIMEYLEAISGYLLTGETSLHQFYWMFGLKNNGKSSLVNIWRYILGDINPTSYFELAPQDLFAKTQNKPHPQIFMRFAGKRMVLIDEFDGDSINEALIKGFLSGSPISAREMHGAQVMYIPQCKLIFTSNHKPSFKGNDGGFVKRLHLLDFVAQIPDSMKIDKFDIRMLRPEAPYILNRMMRAAQNVLTHQQIALPAKFEESKAEFVGNNNMLEQFITQCTETGEDKEDTFSSLFKAYQMWCQSNTYEPMNANSFSRKLSDLNFKSKIVRQERGKALIKLKAEWTTKVAQSARYFAN